MKNQKELILNHLHKHGSITSLIAFRKYTITRISAVIYKLKSDGVCIGGVMEKNEKTGTWYKRYMLI